MISSQDFVPARFQAEIRSHLILNYAEHLHYPLILGIFGSPGNGKTFQLRSTLRKMGVSILSISAADLESERAGEPGKLVVATYVMAANAIAKGDPAAIVIDDFDTTVGEWEYNTGTVNHQQVIAQIMHLADSPEQLEKIGTVRRVPIFLTGNDFSKLYPPLRRPGRMLSFFWSPDSSEMEAIVSTILDFLPPEPLKSLVAKYQMAPISFFAEIRVRLLRDACSRVMERWDSNMRSVIKEPERYRMYTLASFDPESIDPAKVFRVAEEIISTAEATNVPHLKIYKAADTADTPQG